LRDALYFFSHNSKTCKLWSILRATHTHTHVHHGLSFISLQSRIHSPNHQRFFVLSFPQRCNSYDVIHTFDRTKATFITRRSVAHPLVSRCGDYRLECLQASAHVRAHFGMDGRRQDNKAIRAYTHMRATSVGQRYSRELQMQRTFDRSDNLFPKVK